MSEAKGGWVKGSKERETVASVTIIQPWVFIGAFGVGMIPHSFESNNLGVF